MFDGLREQPERPAWTPILIALALVAATLIVLTLLYFHLAGQVFQLLGLSPLGAVLLLCASFLGSMVNIPLTRRRLTVENPGLTSMPEWMRSVLPMVYYYPPVVVQQIVAINVGGAIIPIAFSIYLLTLPTTPRIATIGATVIVAVIAKALARPAPGRGIALPALIPLLVTAVTAHFLTLALGGTLASAAPVAYISGTLGTLIGADLLNLPQVLRGSLMGHDAKPISRGDLPDETDLFTGMRPQPMQYVVSIGGAGVFDGIFVTSVLAPLLAVL